MEQLDRFARDNYGKRVIHLAMRWVLDRDGTTFALWGARRPEQLDAVSEIAGWQLDAPAMRGDRRSLRHASANRLTPIRGYRPIGWPPDPDREASVSSPSDYVLRGGPDRIISRPAATYKIMLGERQQGICLGITRPAHPAGCHAIYPRAPAHDTPLAIGRECFQSTYRVPGAMRGLRMSAFSFSEHHHAAAEQTAIAVVETL